MGQPTPPGDMPLVEGLGPEWNEFVSAIPEDRRAELGPRLKERVSSYESRLETYKPWEDLQRSGITPEYASTALGVYSMIENDPRKVYEAIGNHLGVSPAQAQQVVEEIEENGTDAEIANLKKQVETMAQITIAQRQQENQSKLAQEQDAKLDAELKGIQKKYGDDVPEDEIIMRMLHKNMTAEEAYTEYSSRVSELRKRTPAPMIMGGGGNIPSRAVDVTKLDNKGTKNIVAQMLAHANNERNS